MDLTMILVVIATLLFYITLLLELTIWNIPSVASSDKILKQDASVMANYTDKFQRIFHLSKGLKLVLFFLPLVFIYIAHFFPLLLIVDFVKGEFVGSPITTTLLIGSAIVLIGRAISLIYIFTIRKNNKQIGDSFQLHTSGVFKYSRNPGLMGMYVSFLGFFILLPNIFFGICLVIYLLHMHYKILMEENFLQNKFGEPYHNYLKISKRYL